MKTTLLKRRTSAMHRASAHCLLYRCNALRLFRQLLLFLWPFALSAQNGVTVSNLVVTDGSPTSVTFEVSWDKTTIPAEATPWSDTVWVFVDYNNNGTMERLPLLPGATLTATSAPGTDRVEYATNNNKGVWVIGNARNEGSFSATVQLLIDTDAINHVSGGACVYASNYPPVGEYTSADNLVFTGTPPYAIVLRDSGSGTISVSSPTGDYSIISGQYTRVESFTDKTGAPGRMKCIIPAAQTLLVSASSFCAGSNAGVTFALSGTQAGAKYQLYRDGNTAGPELNGTDGAATFSGTFNIVGTYTARAVNAGLYCAWAMSGSHEVSAVPLPAPGVADATFCFGLPGQLQASASGNTTIVWYDASTAGNLLYTGNVLPLTPLYNDAAQYYAQAVSALESSCVSVRTQAHYTVNNCVIAGECPNFTAGAVGSGTRPAACSSFYPGRINATDYPAACVSFDAGHIGRSQ